MSSVRRREKGQSGSEPQVSSEPEDAQPLQAPPPTFLLPLNIAFYITASAHILAALYSPILDCDETFNYWEPLHYLSHGYGLQTWEYSPEFSIRSWAYILVHAVPIKVAEFFGKSKVFQFYLLRIVFALTSAATETRLYSAISTTLNPRIAIFYLMIVAFTPGIFHASVAFLPSSFAMYTSTLGLAAFMDWRNGPKTAAGIFWFAAGASLGWPFAGVLILPFCLEDYAVAIMTNDLVGTFKRYVDGTIRVLLLLFWQIGVDSYFYKKLMFVPWRIVSYNVFSGPERGPNIFGTEPWSYYVMNLLLNFNVWFLLALSVGPFLLMQGLLFKQRTSQQTLVRTAVLITPFYLWYAIFTAQPHKEERFMYPAYPFLALNAAIAFHMVLTWISVSDSRAIIGKIPARLKVAAILLAVLFSLNIGLLRILGTITGYRAPLQILERLETENLAQNQTICLGKDWYRFPTSFQLPNSTHAKFIKSAYDGLLPGEFREGGFDGSSRPGTWVMPSGMNDQNREDPSKHVDISQCDYLVESSFGHHDSRKSDSKSSGGDSHSVEHLEGPTKDWDELSCKPFLDASSTSVLPRIVWVPTLRFNGRMLVRHYGRLCLYRRKLHKAE